MDVDAAGKIAKKRRVQLPAPFDESVRVETRSHVDLGGYLSEGFDIVMASGVLIKNALGLGVFVVLVLTVTVPIIKMVLFSAILKLTAGIIEPVGDPKISELIYNTASNINLLIACVAGVGFLIFVMLMLVIGAFNVGVL